MIRIMKIRAILMLIVMIAAGITIMIVIIITSLWRFLSLSNKHTRENNFVTKMFRA